MKPVIEQFSSDKTSAPVIGISGSRAKSRSVQAMTARVREANARPMLLANHGMRHAEKDLPKCDAVIILGNNFDADPKDYIDRYPEGDPRRRIHPETRSVLSNPAAAARAAYEKALISLALEAKMPLFCICGGMHQLNIVRGGTLHQHIPDLIGHNRYAKNDGKAASSPVVPVFIVPDTLLARVAASRSLFTPSFPPIMPSNGTVNSFHHQAVDIVGHDLTASAFSESYIDHTGKEAHLIEAIEADPNGTYKDQFLLGVQWHPEFLPDAPTTARILHNVSTAAGMYAEVTGHSHSMEDVQHENILSALPMLKEMANHRARTLQDTEVPQLPGKPSPSRGRSR